MTAEATKVAIDKLRDALVVKGGSDAMSYRLSEQYIQAFSKIAKEGNTIIMPSDISNVVKAVTNCAGIFGTLTKSIVL